MQSFDGQALTYDLNGNLTGDGTNSYTFDARNHLTAISGGTTFELRHLMEARLSRQ